ncbi:MAG: hypothetical protein ACREIL_03955, partial [Nitrospiraceae bacterium]
AGVGAAGEQLVSLVTQWQSVERLGRSVGFNGPGRLVVWRPERGTAEVLQEFPTAPGYSLGSVSSSAALVVGSNFPTFSPTFYTTLAPLHDPASAVLFPGVSLFDFVLLEPDFLYNTADLKFYRRQPPLQRTPLPATLAPLPSGESLRAAYHAVRLQ